MKPFLSSMMVVCVLSLISFPVSGAQVRSGTPKEVILLDQDEISDLKREVKVKPGWPKELTIGSAPVGGTYYMWGGGFAKLLEEKVGVPGYMVITGGPLPNTRLVDGKRLDLGMVTSSPLWEGWHGEGWAKGKKYRNIRIIFPMYASYFQIYVKKTSGIKSLYDLNGKNIGVGPSGGTAATYWPKLLEMAGIKTARMVRGDSARLNQQFKEGALDANAQAVGLPWMLVQEMETTQEIHLLSIPRAEAEKFIQKYPHFALGTIPKGYYKCNAENEVETITVWNFMIVHKDAPEDLVYEVVKRTFENVDLLISAHPAAKETRPEHIVHSPVPLHPGAARYYKEKNIPIPQRILVY
ncbi:MAG: TAXI family TRAP transporter solute-binding subunit [Desulfobacterota bacterium]|nr:TAXI family TRAP transporter solute-binding subunit [Thermodesulfobacteriota bacterium]